MLKTLADLFCGMGGFIYGLGKTVHNLTPVYACDIDKCSRNIYEHLHKHKPEKDLVDSWHLIPKNVSILTAGFPCQPYSSAGYRKGLDDYKRAQIPMEYMLKAIKEKRPEVIVLENVSAFLNYSKYSYAREWLFGTLELIGYKLNVQIYSPDTHGNLAQSRKRMFVCGALNGYIDTVEEIERTDQIINHLEYDYDILTTKFLSRRFVNENKLLDLIGKTPDDKPYEYVYQRCYEHFVRKATNRDALPTITCHTALTGVKDFFVVKVNDTMYRILSPRELLSLQGFPKEIASDYLYSHVSSHLGLRKRIGNSVSPTVVSRIGEKINDYFNSIGY